MVHGLGSVCAEEFLVLLPYSTAGEAVNIAERLRRSISDVGALRMSLIDLGVQAGSARATDWRLHAGKSQSSLVSLLLGDRDGDVSNLWACSESGRRDLVAELRRRLLGLCRRDRSRSRLAAIAGSSPAGARLGSSARVARPAEHTNLNASRVKASPAERPGAAYKLSIGRLAIVGLTTVSW